MTSVVWTDVAPRDGLQSIKDEVATHAKIALVNGLLDARSPRVEATALVSPKWVPQLADAEEVIASIEPTNLDRIRVLIPNLKGMERALSLGINNVLVTIGATDSFNQRNVNRPVAESMAELPEIIRMGKPSCRVDVALSVVFGCPFEGTVPVDRVADLSRQLFDASVDEIGLADTIGVATPQQVREVFAAITGSVPVERLSAHFHDTRGLGIANVLAAYESGVTHFDGSAGGVGGCPFAPKSTGNVCSEDAIAALISIGAEIDVDLEAYCKVSEQLASTLGHDLPGKLYRAGLWHPDNL